MRSATTPEIVVRISTMSTLEMVEIDVLLNQLRDKRQIAMASERKCLDSNLSKQLHYYQGVVEGLSLAIKLLEDRQITLR